MIHILLKYKYIALVFVLSQLIGIIAYGGLTCVAFEDFFQSSDYVEFHPTPSMSRYKATDTISAEVKQAIDTSLASFDATKNQWQMAGQKVPYGEYIFVINKDSKLYIASADSKVQHGNLSKNEAVLGFGEMTFIGGLIEMATPASGLYYSSAREQIANDPKFQKQDYNHVVLSQVRRILKLQDYYSQYAISQFLLLRVDQ